MIEYLFEGKRRKFTIGILDKLGAVGESISSWLGNGRLSFAQARAIASQWKADRQAGRDPVAEYEEFVPVADRLYDEHVKALRREGSDDG